MDRFLPEYIGTDGMEFPHKKNLEFKFLGLEIFEGDISWTNITYGQPTLDI